MNARKPKLSKEMERGLEMAECSSTQTLYRWPGGYWCGDPWPGRTGKHEIPIEHVGTQTAIALLDRDYFQISERLKRGDPCALILTL